MPRRSAAAAAVLTVLAAVTAVPAADAAPARTIVRLAPVGDGAVFNTPSQPRYQYRIIDHLRRLIADAATGSDIRIAVQFLTLDTIANDLVAAKNRGVNVKAIVDFDSANLQDENGAYYPTPAIETLKTGLGTNQANTSWITVCTRDAACIGTAGTPVMQNKFALFSNTSGATNVVVQSSANLSAPQAENAWNYALTQVGNTALYSAYAAYFADLAAMKKTDNYYRTTTAGRAQVYFYPRAQPAGTPSADTDTVVETLNNVTCTGNTGNGGKTIIRVGMYLFTRGAIAQKLWDLDNAGCQVQILYADLGTEAGKILTTPGGTNGGPEAKNSNTDYTDPAGNPQPVLMHSKYLLIEGNYTNKPDQKVTLTGSANYSIDGLRYNDDTLLKLDNPLIHDQYARNFQDAWAAAPTTLHRTRTGHLTRGPAIPKTLKTGTDNG